MFYIDTEHVGVTSLLKKNDDVSWKPENRLPGVDVSTVRKARGEIGEGPFPVVTTEVSHTGERIVHMEALSGGVVTLNAKLLIKI